MFGCTTADLDEAIAQRSPCNTPKDLAFSMLSDVQEMIEIGRNEAARQTINRVKYILTEHVETKETK